MGDSVNPITAGWQILRAIRTTRPPRPSGSDTVDHQDLRPILEAVRNSGVAGIGGVEDALVGYATRMADVMPDELSPDHALAYWINLYNAHALALAYAAYDMSERSVLRVPGVFQSPVATIAGEELSLHDIEHGKARRFGDPRIHAALVCGSVSCPTLRFEPFEGDKLESQLDAQMRSFIEGGGARVEDDVLHLSRVFLWYSGDFTSKMPAWLPARRKALVAALAQWLPPEATTARRVKFMDYDWALGCTVR